MPRLALLKNWKFIAAGIGLLVIGIYIQTLRLSAASADARAEKAIADSIQHDLTLISQQNAANDALMHRTGAATAAAKADATKARAERDKAATDLHEALTNASKTNANLAACLAFPLPDSLLNRLPWSAPSERDGF